MKRYVVAIDQSTSASKVFLLDQHGRIIRRFSEAHRQFYPQDGYVEHDAEEIWQNVQKGLSAVTEGIARAEIAALAISNQRETVTFWERETGRPLRHAVVWQDVRAEGLCAELAPQGAKIAQTTGLLLSPYYSAAKIASVLRCDEAIRLAMISGRGCLGTLDSYLIYRLTKGQVYRTDVSNAGRTQLLRLGSMAWDAQTCGLFGIDPAWLPDIALSDEAFGAWEGVPIIGVLGDSHAALFGQGCLRPGGAKATLGTGSSVMMNVGDRPPRSRHGLSACVAFGYRGRVHYALEGNVTCCGDALCWLRDEAGLIDDLSQAEALASSIPDAGGAYLVPAFSGLGAPYFDANARGAFLGLTRRTTRAHLARAALESMAYQDAEIVAAMAEDTGFAPPRLRVDGGPSRNKLLMQFLADLLGCPVDCATDSELSALGAGYMAGVAAGLYPSLESVRQPPGERYAPRLDEMDRSRLLAGWRGAVARCRTEAYRKD